MLPTKVNLDATDILVLRELLTDPRASIADIARTIGTQRDTVKYRIERMEKRGLITQYNVILNPVALGCTIFMQVTISIRPTNNLMKQQFLQELQQHNHVTHIERTIGPYDYALQMAAIDITDFDIALNEIKQIGADIITDVQLATIVEGAKINDFSGLI